MRTSLNRRQLLGRAPLWLGIVMSFAAPQTSITKAATIGPPQTVIYAFGAALFFQDLDGSTAREEKLALPVDAKIQYLSGSRDGQTLAFAAGPVIYFYDTAPNVRLF